MSDYLFAYGTLAEKPPAEIAALVRQLKPMGEGYVSGLLYDAGEYPGAVLGGPSRARVFGKIFQLSSDRSVLKQLDNYEGFNPRHPGTSLFVRKRAFVSRAKQPPLEAWIYEYNKDVRSLPLIKSGHYAKAYA
ncbi:MAG: hypothetical protein QOI07_1210 [Verrucomicrobiota bacterium]|jgi:gamma-glutamylcyclotransferase (GGCT)/AIG2-like uncharacterized protein YtfP